MTKAKRHPADHVLLAYCENEASQQEVARFEAHLRGCSHCRHRYEQVKIGFEAMRSLRIVSLDGSRAQAIHTELRMRLALRAAGEKQQNPDLTLIRFCIERSHELRYRSPREMLLWARQAVQLAERCNPATAGSASQLASVKAEAWGQLGNALRVADRFQKSQDAFRRAQYYASTENVDPLVQAWNLRHLGSLHIAQRQFEQAIVVLDEAIAICRERKARLKLANCLVTKQIAVLYAGDATTAIDLLLEAIPLIDPADRRLLFAAYQNLAVCYEEAEKLDAATSLLPRIRQLASELEDRALTLRVSWTEARILEGMGQLANAEKKLLQARDGFLEFDQAYVAALVSLDLSAVYLKQGRIVDVQSTMAEVLPIFRSLNIGREMLASLVQLQRTVDQGRALQLIRFLSRELAIGPSRRRRARRSQGASTRDPRTRRALGPEQAKRYLERSYEARYQDPKKMLHWARMARAAAERCDAGTAGGEAPLSDLRARAWGQVGNALRVAGRLQASATAIRRAVAYATKGSGDPALRAQILSWTASLRMFERQFAEAITLLDEVANIHRQLAQRTELASCLSNRAIATAYSGHAEAAIGILNEALTLIDRSDLRLVLAIHHNLIYCFIEAGRLQEARALFPQTRSLGEAIGDELVGLRLLWQEARILCELGMLEEAEAQFSRARQGFLERDLFYDAAVVSFDLTAVYVKLGLHAEVRRTIGNILPIFSSLRVGREILASLIQLQQAEDQTQALQLIRALSRELVAGPRLPPSV